MSINDIDTDDALEIATGDGAWLKAPFPYFGGKRDAAEAVWAALGDVHHYVEPFAGSLAVLLRRPHLANRGYYSETVNDLDGLLVNFWRAVQAEPDAVAHAAAWPVSEVDIMARQIEIKRWLAEHGPSRQRAQWDHYDARIAGWWAWGLSGWIGSGWCGDGPWIVGDDGRIADARKTPRDGEPGVRAPLPNVYDNGRGINAQTLREPGVCSKRPHVSDDGIGINTPTLREPGVLSQLPSVGNDGRGLNTAALREPGVCSKRPHVSNDGRGLNTAALREPGVRSQRPHDIVMPKALEWLRILSARLRHVRILHGDWRRALSNGAMVTLSVRSKPDAYAGVFLDPPYAASTGRAMDMYREDSGSVSHDVRAWCLANGARPELRIVLAGFDGEHDELCQHGWTAVEWYRGGFIKGGMANQAKSRGGDTNQHRERLWLSPHCIRAEPVASPQMSLFR